MKLIIDDKKNQLVNKSVTIHATLDDMRFYGDGERVFSKGSNLHGNLGYATGFDVFSWNYRQIERLTGEGVIKIVPSRYRTLFLTRDGRVFVTREQPYHDPVIEQLCLVGEYGETPEFAEIFGNSSQSLLLDMRGNLYSCVGMGFDRNFKRVNLPKPIVDYSFGSDHIDVIDVEGNHWAWGSNAFGQLNFMNVRHKRDVPEPHHTGINSNDGTEIECVGALTTVTTPDGNRVQYGIEVPPLPQKKRARRFLLIG